MKRKISKAPLIAVGMALSLLLIPIFTTRSQTGSLDGDALAQARRFFSRMSIKCDNYYYYAYRQQRTVMYQCRYPPTISVDGQTYQPRRLSEADRLNGVDPLPIAWQGRAIINLGLCRRQIPGSNGPGANAWEAWVDRNTDAVPLTDKKGQWEFFNAPTGREAYDVKQVLPITCNDIPNASRRVSARPPSWGGQYRGAPVLRLPANYGEWFFLGKGPLTIKLPHTYSWIEIDGTNNSRNPMGQAMYMGAKKTDSNSLVPNAALGSVVVKIGKDGEPFQAFSDRMDPANEGLRIEQSDDVFIAINDSNFADNRGAHLVVVEGGDLNVNAKPGPDSQSNLNFEPAALPSRASPNLCNSSNCSPDSAHYEVVLRKSDGWFDTGISIRRNQQLNIVPENYEKDSPNRKFLVRLESLSSTLAPQEHLSAHLTWGVHSFYIVKEQFPKYKRCLEMWATGETSALVREGWNDNLKLKIADDNPASTLILDVTVFPLEGMFPDKRECMTLK